MASFAPMTGSATARFSKIACSTSLLLCAILLAACSGGEQDSQNQTETVSAAPGVDADSLQNSYWQVIQIDGSPLVPGSVATLILNEQGQLGGDTSCNRYFGRWSVSPASASFETAGVTRRACEPALMEQEQAFLDALGAVTSVGRGEDGGLLLLDSGGAARLELVAAVGPESGAQQENPQDLPGTTEHVFECSDLGEVRFRFLGPDTMELEAGDTRFVLTHQPAASGARYVGDSAEFWNKGDEAMLTIGDRQHSCKRTGES